jgi:hypothetical protein
VSTAGAAILPAFMVTCEVHDGASTGRSAGRLGDFPVYAVFLDGVYEPLRVYVRGLRRAHGRVRSKTRDAHGGIDPKSARASRPHVLTPAFQRATLTPLCRRGISLSQLATPAATKANPAKAGGTKPRVLASLRDAGVVDAPRDPRPPSYRTRWLGGRFFKEAKGGSSDEGTAMAR